MELERNLVFGILSKAFRGGNEACQVIQVSGCGVIDLPENIRITDPCSLFIGAPFWMAL